MIFNTHFEVPVVPLGTPGTIMRCSPRRSADTGTPSTGDTGGGWVLTGHLLTYLSSSVVYALVRVCYPSTGAGTTMGDGTAMPWGDGTAMPWVPIQPCQGARMPDTAMPGCQNVRYSHARVPRTDKTAKFGTNRQNL